MLNVISMRPSLTVMEAGESNKGVNASHNFLSALKSNCKGGGCPNESCPPDVF